MKTILHDMDRAFNAALLESADQVICADGRYAPCQGCFKCWTKHPAACALRDSLNQASRILGASDDLTIITRNLYGGYSTPVKNILDRSIGMSTPLSTYRGRLMHHTLRYGRHHHLRVIAYGDISPAERETLKFMAQRNALNLGFSEFSVEFCRDAQEAGGKIL